MALWEIDFFRGGNEQLVITEIEFRYVRESFDRPPRLDIEVTGRPTTHVLQSRTSLLSV